MKSRKGRPLVVLAIFILIAVLPAGIFFSRAPALVLSDASFDVLYGARRALIAQVGLSLRLFRPVKKALIAESADPAVAAFVLEEAGALPWGRRLCWQAILPARYVRGGQRYAEDHPLTPVTIIGGTPESRRSSNLSYIAADTRTDAYRAGRSAAILSQTGSGEILVFQDEQNFPFDRASFLSGLQGEGFTGTPVFLPVTSNYAAFENISCVVLTGQALNFLDRNLKIPVILFSWLDPALTPANVKLLFDDSPWAMAFKVFRNIPEEAPQQEPVPTGVSPGKKSFPSDIIVQEGRIEDPDVLRKLKSAIRDEIPQ
jgi:hypothetical protein